MWEVKTIFQMNCFAGNMWNFTATQSLHKCQVASGFDCSSFGGYEGLFQAVHFSNSGPRSVRGRADFGMTDGLKLKLKEMIGISSAL